MQTRILLRSMTNGGNTVAIFLKENVQKRTADENQSSSSQYGRSISASNADCSPLYGPGRVGLVLLRCISRANSALEV
jgi:hypothetical protein